ncbi:MAG TPA: hypothetical protein VEL82_06695 [Thermoplasmata archaeon]|nr:hypothetical protein [Thermoplasmata archaeon]
MTDLAGLVAGLVTNVAYGLPLLLLGLLAIAWVLFDHGRFPPRFAPTRPDRTWIRGPAAAVYDGLEHGRIAPVIAYAHYRTARVLARRFAVSVAPRRPSWWRRRRLSATAQLLLRAMASLERAYRFALLAESADPRDLLLRWRRPAWRRRSLALLRASLADLAPVLVPLEGAP